jgi:predicted RND superfamily exporter protein
MDRFFSFIIRGKIIVIAFFILLCVPAVFGIGLAKTSFEISSFLPKDANSIKGTEIERQEFASGDQAYVLLEGKEAWQAVKLKSDIESVPGVESVEWMDDMLDIYKPENFLSQQALEQYKKGDSTIMIITFVGDMGDLAVEDAVKQISGMIEQGEYFGGMPVIVNELRTMLNREQSVYLGVAGGILILILAVSLSSYIAPLLCLVNIGIAILLNYGTNFIVMSRVSFLTVAIASVLQLAISMDFSIFLIHRFEEDLIPANGDTNKAMVSALHTTLVTISSSALTDCAGFIALMFMQNQIGADLGIVLCKGVLFSLITSLTLLPCLILATYRLGKRRHRALLPDFKRLSGPIVKLRYVLLAVAVVVFVPTFIGSANQQYYYTSENFMPDNTDPIIAANKISSVFGTTDKVSVLYDKNNAIYEQSAMDAIKRLDNIREVSGLSSSAGAGIPESFLPQRLKDAFAGGDYRRFYVTLEGNLANDALFSAIDGIKSTAEQYLGDVYITGSHAVAADMASTADSDNLRVDIISIIFIFIIVAVSFKSLLVPLFLVMVIKGAIFINVGLNYFMGEEMIFLTPVFVGAIQLGCTVDYAILFTSRYFEFRHKTLDPKAAVRQAIVASTRPLLTSMLTFFFATLSITLISSIKATREIATVVGRGAMISYIVIMFALPALFVLFDKPLLATTWEFRKHKKRPDQNEGMMVS